MNTPQTDAAALRLASATSETERAAAVEALITLSRQLEWKCDWLRICSEQAENALMNRITGV